MYSALARSAGMQYSAANSARTSATSASAAPQASARLRIVSRSSPPWPTSTARAMTSAPVCSAIHPMATEVSRPPEYASTTRCVIVGPSLAWLGSGAAAAGGSGGRQEAGLVRPAPGTASAWLVPPLRDAQQRRGHLAAAVRLAGDDQHRVVTG